MATNLRLLIGLIFLCLSGAAQAQVAADYDPPALGQSLVIQRNDLNAEYDNINSTKADLTDIDTSAELRAIIGDETGTGALMFGLSTDMADGLACGASEIIRRNAGDNAFECAAAAAGVQTTDIDTSAELRAILGDETGTSFLMFGLSTDMADGLACSASQVVRRNGADNAFECATLSLVLGDADYGDITVSSTGTVFNIDADTITATEIATDAVTSAELDDDTVSIADMNDDSVGIDQLDLVTGDTPADGECLTYDTGTGGGSIEVIECPGAGGGDSITVEDGDNTNAFTATTDADMEDSGDINFVLTGNDISGLVRADSVALGTDTSGNYAAGDGEAGAATSGDSATAFFSSGTIEAARLPAASETAQGAAELATTAEAETGTDTTRAVTAAGVLAAVTGKKPIWIPGGSLVPRTTNGCAIADLELATNDIMLRTCNYDTTTEEGAGFTIRMPDTWDEGTVTAVFVWTHPATVTNFGVVWQIACLSTSNDDAMDAALGTNQEIADTGGTTSDQYTSGATPAVTCAGTPAAGDTVYFEVEREPGNGSDTLAVDAYLLGVTIYYTDNAFVEP